MVQAVTHRRLNLGIGDFLHGHFQLTAVRTGQSRRGIIEILRSFQGDAFKLRIYRPASSTILEVHGKKVYAETTILSKSIG